MESPPPMTKKEVQQVLQGSFQAPKSRP